MLFEFFQGNRHRSAKDPPRRRNSENVVPLPELDIDCDYRRCHLARACRVSIQLGPTHNGNGPYGMHLLHFLSFSFMGENPDS